MTNIRRLLREVRDRQDYTGLALERLDTRPRKAEYIRHAVFISTVQVKNSTFSVASTGRV